MPSKTLKTKNSALFSHHYHHTIHMLKFTHNISRIPLQYHLYRNKKIKINPHHKSLIHVDPKISQVHKLEREKKKERKKEKDRNQKQRQHVASALFIKNLSPFLISYQLTNPNSKYLLSSPSQQLAAAPPPTAMSTANSDNHLQTPILDSESAQLLQAVSQHGGYAYVSMAARAAAGDLRAAEAAREMAWEQLHSGPWHSVLPVWRDAYSMACLHVAKVHAIAGEFSDALRALDMGLIMGGPLLKPDLHSLVAIVSAKARAARVSEKQQQCPKSDRRLVPDDLDSKEVRFVISYLNS